MRAEQATRRSIYATGEEMKKMKEQSLNDLEQTLARLGLEEVEERLEVSPLMAAVDSHGLERDGYSCCCKVPPDPAEDDPEDDGGG
jgi:hypothetical protein